MTSMLKISIRLQSLSNKLNVRKPARDVCLPAYGLCQTPVRSRVVNSNRSVFDGCTTPCP